MFFAQKRGKLFGVPTGAHPLPWMGHDAPTTARIGTCRPMGYSPTSVPEGFQRTSGKPFGAPVGAYPLPRRGMTRRLRRERWGCCPEGGSTFFRSERKYQRKPAARRLRRRPTSLRAVGFGLRYACAWLRASWPSAISGASRPSASLGGGLRPAGAPSGLSSSTGCPVSHSSLPVALLASHPPCGSLWAAPKAPLGPRFPSGQLAALTRRKKALIAHFDGGARNVARNGVG